MDYELSQELQPYLNQSERLLWAGKPKAGILFRTSDLFVVPFSLLWCGFAVFWVFMAQKAGGIFALFGVPFVVIGLYFVFGRFLVDARQRAGTVYGLTEDRILIRSGLFSKSLQSVNIKALTDFQYTEKKDGSGTITLGPKNPMMPYGSTMSGWPGVKGMPMLDGIPNVREVYNRILHLQQGR